MEKIKTVLVLDTGTANREELLSGAGSLGEKTLVVTGNPDCAGWDADEIHLVSGAQSIVALLPSALELVRKEKPRLVLLGCSKDARLAAAQIAAAMETSVFTDVLSLSVSEERITATRLVYGGAAVKTEYSESCAVVCAGSGVFEAACFHKHPVVSESAAAAGEGIVLLGKQERPVQTVDLGAAKRVVGIGRGVKSEETLEKAKALAAALGAELACTRPIAEENRWLPRERYLGVSGASIKPLLYIALGISGQIQHMAGVNQASVILAVNKDKNASIFKQCDYGIVGDVDEILPSLTALFAQ